MSTKNEGCKLCNQKPVNKYDWVYLKEYDLYGSSKPLLEDCFAAVYMGADKDGRIGIWGSGECESRDWYYPNYCPQCGRKLSNEEENEARKINGLKDIWMDEDLFVKAFLLAAFPECAEC